ncbi:unnamed protein product [Thelazia callipaeda]|uniref:LRRCT domain-containing protein n=1 Tax=Thelazia callipaeda TaxID=103827 RepID=A0A0N5CT91_THECL|nr:unnamed protein product [Thelazia callipaeda]
MNFLIGIHSLQQNGLKQLEYLNISHNKIRKIESNNFQSFDSLLELDLAANEFSVLLTSTFSGLVRLKKLNLAEQRCLRRIQTGAFLDLTSLEVLNVSYSPTLEYIDENAFIVSTSLRIFDANFCALKALPYRLFDWERVSQLNLYGNQFHCDRKLLTFLPTILHSKSIKRVVCASPRELVNRSISSLVRLSTASVIK